MKYQRIREQLLSEIMTGAFSFGEDFPSENAVAERFSVSRMTARRALSELERQGYLTRIPGRGNILKRPGFSQGFLTVKPFKTYAKDLGVVPKTQVLSAKSVILDSLGQEKLGVERAVFVHRLRSLDSQKVIEEKRYLRYDLCKGLLKENLAEESIHELLIHKLKLPLTKVWQRLTTVLLSQEQAELFDCSRPMPAFLLERLTYTFEKPISWVIYLMRGDEYSFENEFFPQEELSKS